MAAIIIIVLVWDVKPEQLLLSPNNATNRKVNADDVVACHLHHLYSDA